MKKFLVIIMLCLFIVGCSSPQERYDIADQIVDEIVYQKHPNIDNVDDVIVGFTNDHLYIIIITSDATIKHIFKISKKEVCKGDL